MPTNTTIEYPGYGYVCRNKRGQIGIVLGNYYNHIKDSGPYKYWGIGLRNGRWSSYEVPVILAKNIAEFIKSQKNK
jgi:hypothetical protein